MISCAEEQRPPADLLASVSDGQPGRGRDHPVAAVLALAAAAGGARDGLVHRDCRLGG